MPLVKVACEKRTKFFPKSSLSGQFIGQISENAMTHISIFQAKISWVSKWTTKYVTYQQKPAMWSFQMQSTWGKKSFW